MISFEKLYSFIILFAPVFTAFVCFVLLGLDSWKATRQEWKVKSKVLFFFACGFINWLALVFYYYMPAVFVCINWLAYLTFTLIQVYFYAFVFKITRIDQEERFSRYHYLLPVLLSMALLAVSLITPFEGQLQIVKERGMCSNPSLRLFFTVSNSKMLVRFLFSMVYTVLCFLRLHRYRQFIAHYSANEEKSQLRWLSVYLFMVAGFIPIPLMGLFSDRMSLVSSYLLGTYVFSFILQFIYLCFYVIKGHYIVLLTRDDVDERVEAVEASDDESPVLKKHQLTREGFEQYMQTQKPFLNPDLKITGLVEDLNINRSYISSFINTEYRMNFSNYINQCRLNEYKRLEENPRHHGKTKQELAEIAGFSSYKSFQRALAKGEE